MRIARLAAIVLALVAVVSTPRADAAEIKVLCSTGLKAVMEELVPRFEQTTGNKVTVTYGLAATFKERIDAGEPFDVAVLTPAMIDDAVQKGLVVASSKRVIARSALAFAIRSGARKPPLTSVEEFKRVLRDAKSIAYAKAGASGVLFAATVDRLGLSEELKPKSILTDSGEAVGAAVVSGKAEIGVLPISEILPVHGAEVLAPFPYEVRSYIVMSGGVSVGSRNRGAALSLNAFLTSPEAWPAIKKNGMERE